MKKEQKRQRERVLTLNHNQNSNNDINISISCNLGHLHSPFHRRLQTENYNPNNSLTSNDGRATTGFKGKKIENRDMDFQFEHERLQQNSHSKESRTHGKIKTQEADQQCQISIKVIKKKKPLVINTQLMKNPTNKLSKNKTGLSVKGRKRLNTEEAHAAPSTGTHKTAGQHKNFFSVHQNVSKHTDFHQLSKIYKQFKKRPRSGSKDHSESRQRIKSADKKKTIDQQKEIFDEMVRKIRKNQQSKESLSKKDLNPKIKKLKTKVQNKKKSQKRLNKSKSAEKTAGRKRIFEQRPSLAQLPKKSLEKQIRQKTSYIPKYDIEPFLLSRVMNSSLMSDSIKMSELTSKELSQRKPHEIAEQTLANKHSIQLVSGLRQMREIQQMNKVHMLSKIPQQSSTFSNFPQEHIDTFHRAASIIKQRWMHYHREKIIHYYSRLFKKNQEKNDLQNIFQSNIQHEISIDNYENSLDGDEQFESPFEEQEQNPFNKTTKLFEFQESLGHKEEKIDEEQESQFDINKYQGLVGKSIENTVKQEKSASVEIPRLNPKNISQKEEPIDSRSDRDNIKMFKQQQLEQWNHINQLINRQLNQNEMDPNVLLQQLMKQSELNKKWIEESCDVSVKLEPSPQNSRAESRSSQKSQNYRNLIEERGIAERLKRNSQNIKQMLCNTYEIDKSERSISRSVSRRSNSMENLQEKEVKEEKSQKVSKGGNSSKIEDLMNQELMNDDDSDFGEMPFKRKKRQKNELIDQFLDCGLNECGFQDSPLVWTEKQQRQRENMDDQELRKRSRNLPITKDVKLSPKPLAVPPYNHKDEEEKYADEILMKISDDHDPPKNILINEQSLPNPLLDEDNGDNEPVSHLFQQQKFSRHGVFQSIYHLVLEEFCIEIAKKSKFQRDFNNFFSGHGVSRVIKQTGIKTNYSSIKSYLINLVNYIMSNAQEKQQVLKNVNTLLGPTSAQMLYYLRIQDYMSDYESSSEQEEEAVIIISYETFQRFEKHLEKQHSQESHRRNITNQNYRMSWHRALLECMNEALDEQRPYGTHGKPYDWQTEPRLKNVKVTEETLQSHLEEAASKVLQIVSFLGGILFEKEDSPFFGTALPQDHKLQINEDRLSRILATELYQTEDTWIYYNDEKLQISLELSSLVYERLMFEVAAQFNKVRRRRVFLQEPSDPFP